MEYSKFDQLIYWVKEANLPEEEQLKKAKELFPLFDTTQKNTYNDRYLTPYDIECFAYNRSLGLPVIEVANSIRKSATLFNRLFQGEGLSLETLVNLCEAEVFAEAELKASHMKDLEKTKGHGANVTFLEKAFAKQYGDRKQIDINTGFGAKDDEDNSWKVEIVHVKTQPKMRTEDKEALES